MHIPTLLQLAPLLMAVVTCVMLGVWHYNRRIPGLAAWTGSFVVCLLVTILLAKRDVVPQWLAVVGTQTGMFLTSYLALAGSRSYVGRRPLPPHWPLAALLAMNVAGLYFTWVVPMQGVRIMIASLAGGALYIAGAFALADVAARVTTRPATSWPWPTSSMGCSLPSGPV